MTATRPTASKAPAAPATWQLLNTIMSEVEREFFERRQHIELLLIAMLAGENVFFLGPPGVAKSALIRRICNSISGAVYFDALLDKQLPLESLFGQWDIPLFKAGGPWQRDTDGFLPRAHVGFLDEVGKAGAATTNPLLTCMNEKMFHNGKLGPQQIPLITLVGASNEEIELPEGAAVWDRFLLRVIVDAIQEDGHFTDFLRSKVVKGQRPAPTTIDLAALLNAKDVEVPAIIVPDGIIDVILQLKHNLAADGVVVSDRRWGQCVRVLQAQAYLAGRDTVDDDDIPVLQYVLWEDKSLIKKVTGQVLSLSSPTMKMALDLEGQVDEIEVTIGGAVGKSTEVRAPIATQSKHQLTEILKKANETILEAQTAGRSTTRLDSVVDKIRAAIVRVHVDLLGIPQERAVRVTSALIDPL